MLNNVWEEQKKHRANATCEDSDRDAVQQFYRHTCFLLPSSDSGPEASSEEKGCPFFQDESDDPKDVERMWSEMYNSKDERLTEEVVVEMKVATKLDDFFAYFLSDDAPASLARNHENTGDSDVKCTAWEHVDNITKKRRISYMHPIGTKFSMAPGACAATKIQAMRRFGDHGICVDTETHSNGIPLADCFYVMDRLLVALTAEGVVLVTITFGNTFVKRTLFRKIIIATSVKDVTEFHMGFVELIRDTIGDDWPPRNLSIPVNVPQSNDSSNSTDNKLGGLVRLDFEIFVVSVLLCVLIGSNIWFFASLNETNKLLERMHMVLLTTESFKNRIDY